MDVSQILTHLRLILPLHWIILKKLVFLMLYLFKEKEKNVNLLQLLLPVLKFVIGSLIQKLIHKGKFTDLTCLVFNLLMEKFKKHFLVKNVLKKRWIFFLRVEKGLLLTHIISVMMLISSLSMVLLEKELSRENVSIQ